LRSHQLRSAIAAQPPDSYHLLREWVGRLLLPTVEQHRQTAQATQETDWAELEVEVTPANVSKLVG